MHNRAVTAVVCLVMFYVNVWLLFYYCCSVSFFLSTVSLSLRRRQENTDLSESIGDPELSCTARLTILAINCRALIYCMIICENCCRPSLVQDDLNVYILLYVYTHT